MAKKAALKKQTTEVAKAEASNKRSGKTSSALTKLVRPFSLFIGYVAGSWRELKQVRWPSRRSTWGLTLAVLIYTIIFVIIIIALDTGFQYLLNRILL